ncbi:AraC family transcriptional regulator [Dyella tabacisoli]|uniref:AraC family transcriptional regulator n=1 Tax=Dyella tabacisoli TaxID=2282381 RepID=A0A369UHE7_9GAMM|nr:AraC family transcriptional regulator [Dyella tabacisoli]RDD79763.1 AraC family transcriptional regulator [Dyella tabacisoli]
MDTLSELLEAHPARGSLDIRCQWSGQWAVPHVAEDPGVVCFHVVMRGRIYVQVPGHEVVSAMAGDVIVLPGGDAHVVAGGPSDWDQPLPSYGVRHHPLLSWRTSEEDAPELDMFCGRIDFGQGASALLTALPRIMHMPGSACVSQSSLEAVVEMMRAEVQQASPGSRCVVGQLSLTLFTLVLRHWWSRSEDMRGVMGLLREPRLRPAALAMLSRFHETLTIEWLASSCHMSRASFLRLFERVTQATPAGMLSRLRMDAAAGRLMRSRESISQIAAAVGFQSDSAFIRAFERQHGMTPAAYRHGGSRPG